MKYRTRIYYTEEQETPELRLVFGCFLFRRVDLGGELDLEISQSIGLAGGNLKATSLSTAPLAYDFFRFVSGPPKARSGRPCAPCGG